MIRTEMNPATWAMLLTLSLLWGGSFFLTGYSLPFVPPFTIVAIRFGGAALILLAVMRADGLTLPRDPQIWAAFLAMGLLNNAIPFSLIVWSQTAIASGTASILNATTPVWTVLLAHLLLADEKLTPLRAAGVATGFLGAVLVIGPGALLRLEGDTWAMLAVVGAACSYACAGIFGRRFARLPAVSVATGQSLAAVFWIGPPALLLETPWRLAAPPAEIWLALAAMAALSTAAAYLLYFRILAVAGATNLLLVTLLIPASALGMGAAMLGETIFAADLAGMAVIGLGLALIDGRLPRRLFAEMRATRLG